MADPEYVCNICLSAETSPLASLPCGHVLHFSCITQWLKVTGHCPECRFACTQQNVVRLYLQEKTVSTVYQQLEEKYRTKSEECQQAQAMVQMQQLEIKDLQRDERAHQVERAVLQADLRKSRAETEAANKECQRLKTLADREASKAGPNRYVYGAGKVPTIPYGSHKLFLDKLEGDFKATNGQRLRKIDARWEQSESRDLHRAAMRSGSEERGLQFRKFSPINEQRRGRL